MTGLQALYDRCPPSLQTLFLNLYASRIELHRYGPRYRRELAWLRARERATLEDTRRYQLERLQAVVAHAHAHSPFHAERLAAIGYQPGDLQRLDDLALLPLTTKEEVRQQGDRIMTDSRPGLGWLHGHTSGTTGSPLSLWYDRATCIMTNAVDRQYKSWGGALPGAWVALLLGRAVVPAGSASAPFWRANHVQRQLWMSSFHLRSDWLPAYLREIRRRGIRFVEGYPSTVHVLARHVLESGASLPLEAAFTSSETLHQAQREDIERAFGCRVFDYYGAAERVAYAGECEVHAGKHLAEEYGYVEVVRADGSAAAPGEPGYLVGTSLHNLAFPLLRYRMADMTQILEEPCSCGRPSRRIADVTTKDEDLLLAIDGRFVSPSILTHPFKPLTSLRESQVIQESRDLVRVLAVSTSGLSSVDRQALVSGLQARLGAGMTIEVQEVDAIPRERSGKFRWVIRRPSVR